MDQKLSLEYSRKFLILQWYNASKPNKLICWVVGYIELQDNEPAKRIDSNHIVDGKIEKNILIQTYLIDH